MNTFNWLKQLNKKNYLRYLLEKNKNILEYIFGSKVDFDSVIESKKQKDYFILFGFLSIILWFKIHIEKKFTFKGNKLTEIILDI